MNNFDFLSAAGLVFFLSIPLSCAVQFMRTACKSDVPARERVYLVLLSVLALVFAFWVSFRRDEFDCDRAVEQLWQRGVLFVFLLPTAHFIERAYLTIWRKGEQKPNRQIALWKSLVLLLVFEVIGVGVYALWLNYFG